MKKDEKGKESLEDYEILNMIGRGGFACVYKAKHKSTGEVVAIKIIEKRRMKTNGMIERVKKEVEIHSRLKHPSILELYSFCEDSNYVYLILEMCSRGELYSYLEGQTTPLSQQQVQSFVQEVVSGMKYLHTHAILHRDLSLTNLLLTDDLHVKIADFGLATKLSQPGEQHFTLCGTPNYISPEVATRTAHSLETDLWSLGCMLYTMLVGKPPFDTEGAQPTLRRVIAGEYELPPHVSSNACNLIQSLLQKNPSDRLKLDQVLSHPFFTESEVSQKTSNEDSGYSTVDSTVSPMRIVNTSSPADTCQPASKQAFTFASIADNCDTGEKLDSVPPVDMCQPGSKAVTSAPSSADKCQLTSVTASLAPPPLVAKSHLAGTGISKKSVFPRRPSAGSACATTAGGKITAKPHLQISCPHAKQKVGNLKLDKGSGLRQLQRERLDNYVANRQRQQSLDTTCTSSSLMSENTFSFSNSDISVVSSTGAIACAPVTSLTTLDTALANPAAKASSNQAPTNKVGIDLGEPDFTSTPITDRPTKPLITTQPNPVVIAEFELTGNNFIRPIREALLKALPAAEKKATVPPAATPLKGVLETIQKRCKLFLEKCSIQSPVKQKRKCKEMEKVNNTCSPAVLSPISQNKIIKSAGILSSPPLAGNRHVKDGRGGLQPFTSERLRPIRQRTRNAIVNIMDNGDIRLEFLKSRSPTAAITEIFNISWNGTRVSIYRPGKGCPPLSTDLTDVPSTLPPTATQYTNLTLPKKYWKKYLYAARFIKMVKSKTPKVTYFSDQAKCMLMESEEEFEAVFYSGPKFTICSHHVKVIDTTGMNISFDTESESSLLSAEVHAMWQHIKMCQGHCISLEKMLTSAELPSSSDSSHFPVIIGSRWTANNSLPETVAVNRQTDFDVQPPTMCSFDGSLMSSATSMHQVKPMRLSPERHINLPPYQKTASISTSDGSSQILLRRHVKNIGYASQLRNGAVCVQFDDGYQLTVYAHKSEVTFVYTSGVISRFTEEDELPDVVRSKLECLGQVIAALAAMQAPL